MSIVSIVYTTVTNPSVPLCALGICYACDRPQRPESGNSKTRCGDSLSSERWPCIGPMSRAQSSRFLRETGSHSPSAYRVNFNNCRVRPWLPALMPCRYQGRNMSGLVPSEELGAVR